MIRLIVLPLPAASRPSKTMTMRLPSARTHRPSALTGSGANAISTSRQRPRKGSSTLSDAAAKLHDAIEKTVQAMIAEAKEMERQESSRIVVP